MQQLSVAAVNRCVVRNGGAKAANQHVAGLRTGCADTVKSRRLQIIQIEIVTMPPPVVVPVKIRHINPRQMIGITEQRVTVKNPMFKLSSGQVWHTAEFMYRRRIPATTAGRFEPAACGPHRSDTAGRRDGCEPAPQYPLRFSPQPVLRRHTEIILRRGRNIHTGRYRSPACVLTTKPHDSAGAHRRACARISCSFMKIYCESLLMERKPPKFPVLLRRAHPRRSGCMHLLPDRR